MDAQELFEAELLRRGLPYVIDPQSGRFAVTAPGKSLLVSVENLARQFRGDNQDAVRVARFADKVIAAGQPAALTPDVLYWCLGPNDYGDRADYRAVVSPRLDRILMCTGGGGALGWITRGHLSSMNMTVGEASDRAWSNLDSQLREAQITTQDVDGTPLAMLATEFPSKASLLLAPGLRKAIHAAVGWPVLAVAPDRDFVYLWTAERRDLIPHLAGVVTREHARAPYPLSTEVFEIGDSIRAIGTFAS